MSTGGGFDYSSVLGGGGGGGGIKGGEFGRSSSEQTFGGDQIYFGSSPVSTQNLLILAGAAVIGVIVWLAMRK